MTFIPFKMKWICSSSIYLYWRGEIGNYLLLVLFILTVVINIVVGILAMNIKQKQGKLPTYLLIKLFCGNILLAGSQVFITYLRLCKKMTCQAKLISYVLHQYGMLTGSTGLLVMIITHYRHVVKDYVMTPAEKVALRNKAIICQISLDIIGGFFISIPIYWERRIAFGVTLIFEVIVNALLIVYCWRDRKALTNQFNLPHMVTYTNQLKKSFNYLQPTIWLTASLRIYYIVVSIIPGTMTKGQEAYMNIPFRWAAMVHYLTFFLMPIVIAVKKEEIRKLIRCKKRNTNVPAVSVVSISIHTETSNV